MRQLFAPGADAIFRLWLWAAGLGIVVLALFLVGWAHSDYIGGVGIAREQPVQFSHKHHSGELGLDCRNCHQQVEQQATAGLPPTHTCMTCHSQIWTGSGMLEPVRASLANNEPLHWARVNRLPDYVFYNHSIHVSKGVGCSSCHGPIDTMQLTYRAKSFKMEFCIECHRHPELSLRAPQEVWNMEWTPPPDQAALGAQRMRERGIERPEVLTACSICHR